jgi:hypothetical protein
VHLSNLVSQISVNRIKLAEYSEATGSMFFTVTNCRAPLKQLIYSERKRNIEFVSHEMRVFKSVIILNIKSSVQCSPYLSLVWLLGDQTCFVVYNAIITCFVVYNVIITCFVVYNVITTWSHS